MKKRISAGYVPSDFKPGFVAKRKLVECTPRGGLPNFFRKLEEGRKTTVVYFGGSITDQDGYRLQSLDYLQSLFPKAELTGINSAIGGTASDLGALRVRHDVIEKKPDLVFVEYAVNDSSIRTLQTRRSMEGIVRQIWKAIPDCDILFVYTITSANVKELCSGKMSRPASAMEDLADYYNIPSIHMAVEIAKLLKKQEIIMTAERTGMTRVSGEELNQASGVFRDACGKIPFAPDGTHPYNDTGHLLYTNAIRRAMPLIIKAGKKAVQKPLPEPMLKNCYESIQEIPSDDPRILCSKAQLPRHGDINWEYFDIRTHINRFPAGTELTFRFKGARAVLYLFLGPGCGKLEYRVDNRKAKVSTLFDPYCTYYRLAILELAADMDPEKVHTVRLHALKETFDKRSILFDHNKPHYDNDPEFYKPLDLYLGTIFLDGILLEK